jgi:type II secretory ATPase GspE/PulE/Tfp pilus assembly ATPase PilB-like protein
VLQSGLKCLIDDGMERVRQGRTTLEEVARMIDI